MTHSKVHLLVYINVRALSHDIKHIIAAVDLFIPYGQCGWFAFTTLNENWKMLKCALMDKTLLSTRCKRNELNVLVRF